jgi:hypothetical protein
VHLHRRHAVHPAVTSAQYESIDGTFWERLLRRVKSSRYGGAGVTQVVVLSNWQHRTSSPAPGTAVVFRNGRPPAHSEDALMVRSSSDFSRGAVAIGSDDLYAVLHTEGLRSALVIEFGALFRAQSVSDSDSVS